MQSFIVLASLVSELAGGAQNDTPTQRILPKGFQTLFYYPKNYKLPPKIV